MKFKAFIAAFAAIIFAGCGGSSYTLKMPSQTALNGLNLPESIVFNGEKFTKGFANANSVEYYLYGQKGYGWSKLITVMHDPNIANIDAYIGSVNAVNEAENAAAKRYWKVTKLSQNEAAQKVLYYPVKGDAKFDKFEANFSRSTLQKCGLVVVFYAQTFDKSSDDGKLLKFLDENQAKFLQNVPKIECK